MGTASLEVREEGRLIFSSNEKWLHPLFELESFLETAQLSVSRQSLELRDKIIGTAAAFLVVRLGIRRVHAVLLSEGGRDVFNRFNVHSTHDELVPRIACTTEGLLSAGDDLQQAYDLLKKRRDAALVGRPTA